MVDVKPSNVKLQDRARRIFRAVLPTTRLSDSQINDLLKACQDNVKLALVAEHHKCAISDATKILDNAGGVLKRALQVPGNPVESLSSVLSSKDRLVLCIDAGGTKCKVVIANRSGTLCEGEAGPCNL
jgi:N-acetylmuramic acid 6-phosphate etherase